MAKKTTENAIKIHFEISLLLENDIFIDIYYIYSHFTEFKWTDS